MAWTEPYRGSDGGSDDEEDRDRRLRSSDKPHSTHANADDEENEEVDEAAEKKVATIKLASVVRGIKNEPGFTGVEPKQLVSAIGEGRERRRGSTLKTHIKRKPPRAGATSGKTGWENPPNVDPGDASDYAPMMGKRYKGSNEEFARQAFQKHGLDWDTMDSETFRAWILAMKADEALCRALSSAFFVFCDLRIAKDYRNGWALAVEDAYDRHEEEND